LRHVGEMLQAFVGYQLRTTKIQRCYVIESRKPLEILVVDSLEEDNALKAKWNFRHLRLRYADHYKYRVGDHLLIPIGYGAMVNHSSTPNMGKVIDGGNVYLEALRDIGEGDELSFSYDPRALERFGLTP